MIYGSVCSGIEAATVAWHGLGWKPSFFSEIDKFPRKVLEHHYPNTPLHGDFTTIQKDDYEPIELLVGGTPCQSFSVAGLRDGLNDPRGNLMLEFGALAKRLQPKWIVWENVPGVLSSNGGKDFGSFLVMLGELGYGFAYRVLDAQFFGLAQRRKRVFIVGCLGDWRSAAAVLFERESLCRDNPPGRGARKEVAGCITASTYSGTNPSGACLNHFLAVDSVAQTLTKSPSYNPARQEGNAVISFGWQNSSNQGLSHSNHIAPKLDKSKTPAVCYGLSGNTIGRKPQNGGNGDGFSAGVSYTLTKTDVHAVAFKMRGGCDGGGKGYLGSEEKAFTLQTGQDQNIFTRMAVRRLTPKECERLQGFPDDYTNILGSSDTARYKALGNSMAVPVMKWIGERIEIVEKLQIEIEKGSAA